MSACKAESHNQSPQSQASDELRGASLRYRPLQKIQRRRLNSASYWLAYGVTETLFDGLGPTREVGSLRRKVGATTSFEHLCSHLEHGHFARPIRFQPCLNVFILLPGTGHQVTDVHHNCKTIVVVRCLSMTSNSSRGWKLAEREQRLSKVVKISR